MKYKVILLRDDAGGGGSPDGMTAVTFYTLNQAISCAQAWATTSGDNFAFLWDGSIWRVYT